MKLLLVSIFTISILFSGCGYKTDPIYQSNKEAK